MDYTNDINNFKDWFSRNYTYAWQLFGGASINKSKQRETFPSRDDASPDALPIAMAYDALVNAIRVHHDSNFVVRLSEKPNNFTNAVTMIVNKNIFLNQSQQQQSVSPLSMGVGASGAVMVNHLLNEKDRNGSLQKENVATEIRYEFEKEKNRKLEEENKDLKFELNRALTRLEGTEKGWMHGLVSFCRENPEFVMTLFKSAPKNIQQQVTQAAAVGFTEDPKPQPKSDEFQDFKNEYKQASAEDQSEIKAIQSIARFASELSEETNVPVSEIEAKLKENKALLKQFLS